MKKAFAALAVSTLGFASMAKAEITTANYVGWDSLGNDIYSVLTGNEGNCAQTCLERGDCTASVFYQGRCWIKNKAPHFTRLANSTLILKVVAGRSGIDYPGGDYRSFESESWQNCSRTCFLESQCRAFTYVTSAKTCWLKNQIVDAGFLDGAVSGKK